MYGVAQGALFCGESMFSRRKCLENRAAGILPGVFRTAEN
jgi:Leu/Phe-tRNA-protein transferase